MINPIQPTSTPSPTSPTSPASPPADMAGPAFTVEISLAKTAPVYVYRMTDTATGRVLVELPNDPTATASDGLGSRLDAKV